MSRRPAQGFGRAAKKNHPIRDGTPGLRRKTLQKALTHRLRCIDAVNKTETYPMKRNTILTGVVLLSLGATSLSAFAQSQDDAPRGKPGPMFNFEQIDANNDGQITPEEITAHTAARFAEADTNGDGTLSSDELVARMQAQQAERMASRVDRMIDRRDANDDGVLSPEEMNARGTDRMFDRLDANDDGMISKAEMDTAREKFEKRGKGWGEHRKGDHGHGPKPRSNG